MKVKFDKGNFTIAGSVNVKEGSLSSTGKSLVFLSETERDVVMDGVSCRVQVTIYAPIKTPKPKAEKAAKVTMTLEEARKAAASK